MSFEFPNMNTNSNEISHVKPEQVAAAKELLKGSALENVGFADAPTSNKNEGQIQYGAKGEVIDTEKVERIANLMKGTTSGTWELVNPEDQGKMPSKNADGNTLN